MRKPDRIERLYLDFDGFFASVMQQAMPDLRDKPVGVIPFEVKDARHTVVIACSKEAKAAGCSNVMPVPDALKQCPDMVLVMQRPDLFRRAHNKLLNEIRCVLPIETIKSIDEFSCVLDKAAANNPHGLSRHIKQRISEFVGPYITCSIGMAPNRMLAKIACKMDKPNGTTIWRPEDLPGDLLDLPFDDIPGIGGRMQQRLWRAGITNMEALWHTAPKEMRRLWGNVSGERMWYALHGYEVYAQPTQRGMYGHGRVLPPEWYGYEHARKCSRELLQKAAWRMRRDNWYANRLNMWLDLSLPNRRRAGWYREITLPSVMDDQALLVALERLWQQVRAELPARTNFIRVGVTLMDLVHGSTRQLDMFLNDDHVRQRWETITRTIERLNRKFSSKIVTIGPRAVPPGGYLGGKIAFNRIPDEEDFW